MRTLYRAGELLQNGQDVILFDCGGDAVLLALSGLDGHFHLHPTALCDSRESRWGMRLQGLPIEKPQEVIVRHPGAWWLICNFLDKAAASRTLEQLGIMPEKILNFTPYERRVSCRYLEGYFHPANGYLHLCCGAADRAEPPRAPAGEDAVQFVAAGEQFRQDTITQLGKGSDCDCCPYLQEGYYPTSRKIEMLNYGGGGICNFRCVYCNAFAKNEDTARSGLNFVEIFSVLRKREMLSQDIHVQFNSGEIGVHPKRTEMFRVLGDATVSVLTNSTVYVPEIAEKLKSGDAIVNTSLDAGTRETFHRVKGVDAWERVCGNLRRYAAIRRNSIVLKYIFLPGINDAEEEVEGFIRVCKELAGFVQISSDIYHPERIT